MCRAHKWHDGSAAHRAPASTSLRLHRAPWSLPYEPSRTEPRRLRGASRTASRSAHRVAAPLACPGGGVNHVTVRHYRTHTTEHTVPLHTLIFCTSVRWNLCIFEVFFWQGSHFRLILRLLGLPFALQADLLLQVGRPFVLQVGSCFRIVFPSLFTYLP